MAAESYPHTPNGVFDGVSGLPGREATDGGIEPPVLQCDQSMHLLATKLHIQPIREEIVQRRCLVDRLNAGLNRNLTLVSAPAGFGKSTLVGEWVQGLQGSPPVGPNTVAWLSLDENDNDYVRFLTYFIGALQSTEMGDTADGLGEESIKLLAMPQAASPEIILTPIVNQIAALPMRIIFVLDDYHFIESEAIHGALTFLVDHMPASMHLVIVTRQDPPLPLARLRARNEMTEIRAADLRFSPLEVAEFMTHTMGLELSDNEITTLATRTEGWAAGLQLAGVSLQGADDVSAAITSFAGSHRHITDYLLQEVLSRQSQQAQQFLLQTSLLDRLSGPLCDGVLGRNDGQQMIQTLEQANLFIIPLDDERRWYRYHHLFADLLRHELRQTYPEQIPILHLRASQWFEQQAMPSDAIRHALAAEDFERAADLAELAWPEWNEASRAITWLGWVEDLPAQLVRARPVLSTAFAFAYLNAGKLEHAEARLIDAERWLEPAAEGMVVVDEEQFRSLPVTIASARAFYAQTLGDVPGSVKYARRALDLLPESDYFERGRLAVLLGLAYWASGDLETAHRSFADAMASFQMAGNILFAISF
ncbi:MAG: hypothetical protein KAU31_02795, partial [Spirochaetaceae bacterium]|nr:hypothetical protein [Spirochaetaceae bacterium]